ncbi:hypothetical protein FA95DRAFT_125155 [Auriscalpium vulgare]|uniref:Uncharacterized protein n=1 Tax=Auriscalpium vulgare TaxID=40419 RepID=A0ACB8RMZ7_9AGAM|nr:hypothetical protein FA95DRAFT_125155 [Auriscalpium vulgare]
MSASRPSKLKTATGECVLGLLADAPPELVDSIFELVDDFADALCLGLAHQHLLTIGMPRIEALYAQELAPWIGHRILCLGDSAGSIPNTILTPAELEGEKELEEGVDDWIKTFSKAEFPAYDDEKLSERLGRKAVDEMLGDVPLAKPWVLCNMTKFQYVRAEAFDRICNADLGKVLLSLICWADEEPSGYLDETWPDIKGRWAGGRFEIMTKERMLRLHANRWKDITKSIAWTVARILRGDDGTGSEDSDDEDEEDGEREDDDSDSDSSDQRDDDEEEEEEEEVDGETEEDERQKKRVRLECQDDDEDEEGDAEVEDEVDEEERTRKRIRLGAPGI